MDMAVTWQEGWAKFLTALEKQQPTAYAYHQRAEATLWGDTLKLVVEPRDFEAYHHLVGKADKMPFHLSNYGVICKRVVVEKRAAMVEEINLTPQPPLQTVEGEKNYPAKRDEELALAKQIACEAIDEARVAREDLAAAEAEIEELKRQLAFEREWAGAMGRGGELPAGYIVISQGWLMGILPFIVQKKGTAAAVLVALALCSQEGTLDVNATELAFILGYSRRQSYSKIYNGADSEVLASVENGVQVRGVVPLFEQNLEKNSPKMQEKAYKDTPIYVYDDDLKNNHMDIDSSSYGGQAVAPDAEAIIRTRCEELGRIGFHWRQNLKRFGQVLPRIPADTWQQMVEQATKKDNPGGYVFKFMSDFQQSIGGVA